MHNLGLSLRLSAQDWIRTDLLKAVQAALLAALPREGVLEFWARHPLTVFKGALPPRAFFRYLWEGTAKVPPLYFWSVFGDLEGFLEDKGIRPESFFRLLNHGPGGGPPLDPEGVRAHLPPFNGTLAGDPRGRLLAALPVLARRMLPGCRMERIPSAAEGADDGAQAPSGLFLFRPLALTRESAVPDFNLFPGKLFLALPRLFGCAAFDHLEVLADMRGPSACLGRAEDDKWNWKGDILRHGSKRMGRLEPLDMAIDGWLEADALRGALGTLASGAVLLMERDFKPRGSRAGLLRGGCAYGSPAFLARIGYAGSRSWERLAAWLRRSGPAMPEPQPPWAVAERLHQELLASLG